MLASDESVRFKDQISSTENNDVRFASEIK